MKNCNVKRILSLALALVLALSVLPAPATAATAQVTCPVCNQTGEEMEWTSWSELAEGTISEDKHLKLTENVRLTEQVVISSGGNLLLDLNGYTLRAAALSRCFEVQGGTLTITDSSANQTGTVLGGDVSGMGATDEAYGGGTIRVTNAGKLHILGGTIRGGYAAKGGNIWTAKGTILNIEGGVVKDGYAVAVDGSTGRGGNIYTQSATTISGNARIVGGFAQYGTGNSGRGGNIFAHNRDTAVTIKGDAIVAGGYAGYRGGNILVNYHATLTMQENAQVYGGTARKYGNNLDVMTATLNMEGGTIYGSPAGGANSNILVYSTESVFNITGGKIYGRVEALAGMTINISGKPYVEHLYLPQTLNADGTEKARALIIPGTFEEGAWVGLEVQAEDQRFTDVMADTSSYMYFFHHDKQGLTWHGPRGAELQYLYLTKGTPCACCGEDKNDIVDYGKCIDITEESFVEGFSMVAGHYRLMGNLTLPEGYTIPVDGSAGYVTLDLNGYTLTGASGTQLFAVTEGSIFNIVDTTADKNGVLKGNGNRIMRVDGVGSQVNIYNGTLTGNITGDGNFGGTLLIANGAELNLYGGALANGTSEDHGGNVFANNGAVVNVHGGTITGGTTTGGTDAEGAFTGQGGNLYITGRETTLNIYGGTITGGTALSSAGGNIMINSGATGNMYDGLIEQGGCIKYGANIYVSGSTGSGANIKYSQFYMYGGTFGAVNTEIANVNGISRGSSSHIVKIYNGTVATTQNVKSYLGDCACYSTDSSGTYIWNYGHTEQVCDIDCRVEEAWGKCYVKTLNTGLHDYTVRGNTCTCTLCSYSFTQDNLAALVSGRVYESLSDALKKADQGSTVILLGDISEAELTIANDVTLDLNGFTVTAEAVSAVGGKIIDRTCGKGLLVCPSVSLADTNPHLPVSLAEGLRFSSITPDHYLERVDRGTVQVRFTFRERSYETKLDDWIKAGNEDITVELHLTWKDSSGNAKAKTYVCDQSLLQKYAEKWNSRRYVATITGVGAVTDLTCTVQISSSASSGVTVAADTLNNVNFINQKLTWDAINGFPIKTKDMTVEEMRQLCVDFMYFTKTYLWTPDQTVNYIRNASGSEDVMSQGEVYGGLPYVGVATGNVYRMMDYINPETGLLDMEKAIPALATKDSVTMADLKYFGSQCSVATYWGWGRVINSPVYHWTSGGVPNNDFVFLGDVKTPADLTGWGLAYNTVACCQENGEQTMYEAYALAQKADGLVQWTTAGHFIMIYSDAVVVRNADGTINGDKSYVMIIDQAQRWQTLTNDAGDTFQHKSNINHKYTFATLFKNSYIPFTFKEFIGEASIEDTTVTLANSNGTKYVDGKIRESDRTYIASKTTKTLTWSDLFASRVQSNYGVVDVYLTLQDASGKEFYRHAVRTGTAGNKSLAMSESGPEVTIWNTANVAKNSTYAGQIEVQLATGERVVIWSGNITT